jgi:hypothetical protein
MRMPIAIIFILGACLVVFINLSIVLHDLLIRTSCPSRANSDPSVIDHELQEVSTHVARTYKASGGADRS